MTSSDSRSDDVHKQALREQNASLVTELQALQEQLDDTEEQITATYSMAAPDAGRNVGGTVRSNAEELRAENAELARELCGLQTQLKKTDEVISLLSAGTKSALPVAAVYMCGSADTSTSRETAAANKKLDRGCYTPTAAPAILRQHTSSPNRTATKQKAVHLAMKTLAIRERAALDSRKIGVLTAGERATIVECSPLQVLPGRPSVVLASK